jgi:anaerobic dimethyl sulfoxide reductase subunit A
MTGNMGISGGSAAARFYTILPLYILIGMEAPSNPAETSPPPKSKLPIRDTYFGGVGAINIHKLTDAIIKGKSGGYPADYKLLYMHDCNYLNQLTNTNRIIQAFNRLEFIVVEEQFMTPTARFADIVLPVTTFLEKRDVTIGFSTAPFYGYRNKVIEPLYEAKSQLEIGDALAARLGISNYNDKTEEEWLPHIMQYSGVPDYDVFREKAVFRIPLAGPYISFTEEINDPTSHPFPTPSGKIEIYSQQLADMENPHIPPIPKYIETWESVGDPLASKYPLQLITTHLKRRAHSQFDNIPWLRELEPQAITINAADAQARGIKDGDLVKVFNDRGRMIIPARVTERIMPGVVDLPQGAWYSPDESGIDRGACANVLTRDEPSPGGALPTNTALVQVEKV